MELKEDLLIAAPRAQVYAALNDPGILKQAIPGCEDLAAQSPTELTATVATKIGPLSARFKGSVTLADLNPPESYTLAGEGKGGPAGFVKVKAFVKLTEEGATKTRLAYVVKAEIGGKLAQLGGPLVERTSKKLAGEFFERFQGLLGEAPAVEEAATPVPKPAAQSGVPAVWWIAATGIAIALAYYALRGPS
ncbi:MAG: carbon monoxide dehydrogenase subunit G [Gammaproteobacteria bacterium]|nr:carbon monoxide dehydrogenase subunit G [Gammaproteobacteria bacterium]MBI5616201.1 carbon monoxide dehydrogenase subunit G [Gammaproteobacteria bacterium]